MAQEVATPPAPAVSPAAAAVEGSKAPATPATTPAAPPAPPAAATPSEPSKQAPAAPPTPAVYALKSPWSEAVTSTYSDAAKELGLSPEAAQKLVDRLAPALDAQGPALLAARRAEWVAAAKADPEIGGTKLLETTAKAASALARFGTPELAEMLEQSGLGDHPHVIRMLSKIGREISEDRFVGSGSTGQSGEGARSVGYSSESLGAALYGKK